MSDSGESTHYQIELTSRQVLAALIVLMICVFAAFFAGVWIGRNAEASSAANSLASVDEVSRGGERFDFFGKTGKGDGAQPGGRAAGSDREGASPDLSASPTAAPAGQADLGPDPNDTELSTEGDQPAITDAHPDGLFDDDAAAAKQTSKPEEVGGRAARRRHAREEKARAAAEQAASGQQGAASTPPSASTTGAKGTPAATASTAAGAPSAASAPAATDKTAGGDTAAGKTAASSDALHIQVLATNDQAKAQALVARLTGAGFKTYIAPSNEAGRTVYRVRVGPITDRAVATKQAQELKSRWGLDSWISPGVP